MNIENITALIKEEISLVTGQTHDLLDQDINFLKLGISSIQALKIINKVKIKLGVELNPVVMFEYKTIHELALYIETIL